MILSLGPIQPAMPKGEEERARKFFRETLGFSKIEKPAALAGEAGCGSLYRMADSSISESKSLSGLRRKRTRLMCVELDELARRLEAEGFAVR